eukprot:Sspe_Gene.89205::Locus_61024_Transcript_1_1_Confidence_1.000_Length_1355::g.89205::m.89205/K18666/ASCC1; activating signal cointegrator complex subunit 1
MVATETASQAESKDPSEMSHDEKKQAGLCFYCGKKGHMARECPEKPSTAKESRKPSGRQSILSKPRIGNEKGVRLHQTKMGRFFRVPIRDNVGWSEEPLGDIESDLNIVFNQETGQYTLDLSSYVKPEFYRFIIGTKAQTLQEIEKDTGASISVPREGDKQKGIIVRGLNESAVAAAKYRIDYVVDRSRQKLPYTHFVSIPLLDSVLPKSRELFERLETFCSISKRIDPSIFRSPEKLHLTLVMLRIYSEEDAEVAIKTLKKIEGFVRETFTSSDRIQLKDLQYMNDDPRQVNVLYLKVKGCEEKILSLVDHVSTQFVLAGLCTSKDIEHNEKLHATIMNSKWRKTGDDSRQERVPFDIMDIMDELEHVDLGTHKLRTIEISTMGEVGENGYFKPLSTIYFP